MDKLKVHTQEGITSYNITDWDGQTEEQLQGKALDFAGLQSRT